MVFLPSYLLAIVLISVLMFDITTMPLKHQLLNSC